MEKIMSTEQMFGEFEVKVERSECACRREFAKEFMGLDLPCSVEDEADSTWKEEELMEEFLKEFRCCIDCPFE